MCLAVPMQVKEIEKSTAFVELEGLQRQINLGLLENVRVGDYVVVHAGFAIQRLDEQAARETIEAIRELYKE